VIFNVGASSTFFIFMFAAWFIVSSIIGLMTISNFKRLCFEMVISPIIELTINHAANINMKKVELAPTLNTFFIFMFAAWFIVSSIIGLMTISKQSRLKGLSIIVLKWSLVQ
jgi:uncharacterized membrane protein HdeD (DUF308 family)